jgi:hypothetical protein
LALVHCVGSDPPLTPPDDDDAAVPDGGAPQEDAATPDDGSCWNRRFGEPVPIPGLSSNLVDLRVSLSPDERTAYFSRGDGGVTFDLYTSTRATVADPWSVPSPMTGLNSAQNEIHPSLAPDNRTLYFSTVGSVDAGGGNTDIFVSQRGSTTEQFTTAAIVPGINSPLLDHSPYRIEGAIFFSSLRNGGTDVQLFEAKKDGGGFSTPAPIAELNVPGVTYHQDPVASADGLILFFSSTRPGGRGDFDIWMAMRPSASEAFGVPVNVGEVNTASIDRPSWISPDGCRLYITSDRPGGQGDLDSWVATRVQP